MIICISGLEEANKVSHVILNISQSEISIIFIIIEILQKQIKRLDRFIFDASVNRRPSFKITNHGRVQCQDCLQIFDLVEVGKYVQDGDFAGGDMEVFHFFKC